MFRIRYDYAMIIWNPHAIRYVESTVAQQRATKMVRQVKNLSYSEFDLL